CVKGGKMLELGLNGKNISTLEKFNQGESVSLRFAFPDKIVLSSINGFMSRILAANDILFLQEAMITILRESILNAVKANAKRVFFEKNNADMNKVLEYNSLMRQFKEKVVGDMAAIESDLKSSSYYAEFRIQKTEEGIKTRIVNNSPLHAKEEERIKQRMESAKHIKDFSEAYDKLYDETEGAGLGIILTMLLLKNSGIPQSNYSISADECKTEISLIVPFKTKSDETLMAVKEDIINEIHLLPSIPTFINELLVLCDDPDSSISQMSNKVKGDPALSADILKLANSAGFAPNKKIETINEALTRIGLSNFKYILLAATTKRIMDQRYKKFEQIWQHSLKVAFYSRLITQNFKLSSLTEQIFISALLHDLGKLVLLAVDNDLTIKIADFVKSHGIRTTTILEEISIGISHSSIGKLISEKWNFAEFITQAIAFHHSPLLCDEKFSDIINIVYLANIFCGIEDRKYDYYFIEPNILQKYNLSDESKCIELHEKCKEGFRNRPML
ncbi:MAG TPA: HDOD domain-containing protein, partial [Spirochaetota bacterium]|nr:HDOD domain-containing protein [Spirochaetota bacterium]